METGQVHGTGRMAHATQGVGPGETVGTPSMAKEEERRAARTSPLLDTSHGPSTANDHPNAWEAPSPTNTMQTQKKKTAGHVPTRVIHALPIKHASCATLGMPR